MNTPKLIVMLTHHDRTAPDASEIFRECKDTQAQYWGLKEIGLPLPEMKALYACMKACGKTTVLEVVAYTEAECRKGAELAVECGCDILMGTRFFDSVNEYCKEHQLRYMPFVGTITGRPSVLSGSVEDMVAEAEGYLKKGVWGIDLLGYRHAQDPAALNRTFVERVDAPVCLAGSINSDQRLEEVKATAPWAFTIGGAFFEGRFGGTFRQQIDKVCQFMQK